MKVYLRLTVILMMIAALAVLSYGLAGRVVTSAGGYRVPLDDALLPAGQPHAAKTGRVVVVIISGLGDDALTRLEIPTLDILREAGAAATAMVLPPTYRQPAWTTLVSGAPPALNDAPPFEVFNPLVRPAAVETIFDTLGRQSGQALVAGNPLWQKMFSGRIRFWPMPANPDEFLQEGDAIAAALDDPAVRLVVFQLDGLTAEAAPSPDGEGELRIAGRVDAYLARLLHVLNMDETTLVVTADFGLLEGGLHGGGDAGVVEVPLVLTGKGIVPGRYSPVFATDVAPTLAVLLGAAVPNRTVGRPLLEMLRLTEAERAQTLVQMAHQRQSLAGAYLAALDMPPTPDDELVKADGFLAAKNFAGAAQLADLLVTEQTDRLNAATAAAQAAGRRGRLGTVLAVTGLLLIFLIRTRSEMWIEAVLGALGAVGAYHLLYRLFDWPYSLSAFDGPLSPLWLDSLPLVALGMLAGTVVFIALVMFRPKTPSTALLNGSFELVLLAALGFFAPALVGLWQIGPSVQQFFPEPRTVFYFVAALSHTVFSVVSGTFVPFFVIVLNFVMQKMRNWYQLRRQF